MAPKNTARLLLLSTGFLLLFSAFNTAQGLAAQVLTELDLGNMGFYSLAVLYCVFGFCSFVATPIVNKCGERAAMFLGALCYTFYIASFILAAIPSQYPSTDISKTLISVIILIAAAINGFGASILWVAQGKYISLCASDENKGSFNGIFWAFFMSSQVFGNFMGAFVLGNLTKFTFYCVMTALCIGASFFFLLLTKPEKIGETAEADKATNTVKQDIAETAQMLVSKRMLQFMPMIALSAFNLAIQASVFIKMMEDTMKTDAEGWDESKRDKFALLAMVGLGVGEISGAIIFGKIGDTQSMKVTIAANMLSAVIGFSMLISYTIHYQFSLAYGFFMTFFWGISDGGLNTLINCMLGFQFDSKTSPFSVNKFVQSLLIFAFTCFESVLQSKTDYLYYEFFVLAFCILTWLSFNFFFKIREQGADGKQYEKIENPQD